MKILNTDEMRIFMDKVVEGCFVKDDDGEYQYVPYYKDMMIRCMTIVTYGGIELPDGVDPAEFAYGAEYRKAFESACQNIHGAQYDNMLDAINKRIAHVRNEIENVDRKRMLLLLAEIADNGKRVADFIEKFEDIADSLMIMGDELGEQLRGADLAALSEAAAGIKEDPTAFVEAILSQKKYQDEDEDSEG